MNKKKLNVISSIVVALLFIFIIIKCYFDSKVLEESHRFTIGKVTKIDPISSAGYGVHFMYSVCGKNYSTSGNAYPRNKKIVGRRFYVMFNPDNPNNCKLLLDKPVSKKIKEAPSDGWVEIPKYKKKRKIRY